MRTGNLRWFETAKTTKFRISFVIVVATFFAARFAYNLGYEHGQRITPLAEEGLSDIDGTGGLAGRFVKSGEAKTVKKSQKSLNDVESQHFPAISSMNAAANVVNATDPASCRVRDILPHGAKSLKMLCPERRDFGQPIESAQRRLAVLVRGESFRGLTGMYDRDVDVNKDTFACQSMASASHVKNIIAPLESCDYKVDVFIRTWKAHDKAWRRNSSQQLIDMYGGRVVASEFDDHSRYDHGPIAEKTGPQSRNYENGLQMIAKFARLWRMSYDAILVIRSDLIFKRPLGNVPFDKVMFAFREWLMVPGDRVADTIHYFPWKFANCAVSQGFLEHMSGGIVARIGSQNLGFLVNERHDSNSMIDRNPLYHMCRPEQKYEMDGGFSLMMFGIEPVTKRDVQTSGSSVRAMLFSQGQPRSVPACDIVCHLWIPDLGRRRVLENLVHFAFGDTPSARDFAFFPIDKVPNVSDTSGWESGFMSLAHVSRRVMNTDNFKARVSSALTIHKTRFHYDRLVFVRLGYSFRTKFLNIFECNVSKHICIGYGSEKFPTVPVIIIASQVVCSHFNKMAAEFSYLINSTHLQTTEFLEKSFGVPSQVICKNC